jgi:hypothetical protein
MAVVLSVALAGCGSDKKSDDLKTSTSTSSSTSATTSTSPNAHAHKTIADCIIENKIIETSVHRGDPGPSIDLPVPSGWQIGSYSRASYGGIVLSQPADPNNPPTVEAIVSKLTGNVDPALILQYASGELQNLPGYHGSTGKASMLSGFQAWQLSGTFTKDGQARAIAQKTVVIPGDGVVFVLQLNAGSLASDQGPLLDATNVIDEQTKITP